MSDTISATTAKCDVCQFPLILANGETFVTANGMMFHARCYYGYEPYLSPVNAAPLGVSSVSPETKPEWTQRPAFVNLVDDAVRAEAEGFDRLCLVCREGFVGATCPHCEKARLPSPEPSPAPNSNNSPEALIAQLNSEGSFNSEIKCDPK